MCSQFCGKRHTLDNGRVISEGQGIDLKSCSDIDLPDKAKRFFAFGGLAQLVERQVRNL